MNYLLQFCQSNMKKLVREYYQLSTNQNVLKTKNGKGFKLVYVDPNTSTDNTFNNKELMKKYGMEYLPYNRYIRNIQGVPQAWGWIVWDGSEQETYPLIKKFAEEIGGQETPPEGGSNRTMDEVLASIEQLKDVIMKAEASTNGRINGSGIIANAEEFKKKLVQGVGSRETMNALAELARFRVEMSKHRGHQLSMLNTILIFLQKRNARDVRSKGEWREMGYTPKPNAVPIVLAMPAAFKKLFGAQYDEVVRRFLEKEGVRAISELTPSQKRRLDRETKYLSLTTSPAKPDNAATVTAYCDWMLDSRGKILSLTYNFFNKSTESYSLISTIDDVSEKNISNIGDNKYKINSLKLDATLPFSQFDIEFVHTHHKELASSRSIQSFG